MLKDLSMFIRPRFLLSDQQVSNQVASVGNHSLNYSSDINCDLRTTSNMKAILLLWVAGVDFAQPVHRLDFGMTFIYSCHDLACLWQILLYLEARSWYKLVPYDLISCFCYLMCSTLNMNSNNDWSFYIFREVYVYSEA